MATQICIICKHIDTSDTYGNHFHAHFHFCRRYFASRASAFTTGSVLRVDGGAAIGGRDPASAKSVRARM